MSTANFTTFIVPFTSFCILTNRNGWISKSTGQSIQHGFNLPTASIQVRENTIGARYTKRSERSQSTGELTGVIHWTSTTFILPRELLQVNVAPFTENDNTLEQNVYVWEFITEQPKFGLFIQLGASEWTTHVILNSNEVVWVYGGVDSQTNIILVVPDFSNSSTREVLTILASDAVALKAKATILIII